MSSMEEIIEIFADAISGFIMLSIKLQENNVTPDANLKPAAQAVVQTSKVLCDIAQQKGEKEYADFEEIQADIFDCTKRVTEALNKFDPALETLFNDSNKAAGWKQLVNATQSIASQTSRLLLTVYGAEHRRLVKAGMILLDSCSENKGFGLMSVADLQARANDMVAATNANSSDLMVFNSYVQARANEIEGPKQAQLKDAVSKFNQWNQGLVDCCNGVLKGPSPDTLKAFVAQIEKIEVLTREILDILAPPEDMDIFSVVQNLSSQRVGGTKTAQNASRHDKPLFDSAENLKKALKPLQPATCTAEKARTQAGEVETRAADFLAKARAKLIETGNLENKKKMEAVVKDLEKERANVNRAALDFAQFPDPNKCSIMNAAARAMESLVDDFLDLVHPEAKAAKPGDGGGVSARLEQLQAAADSARAALADVRDNFEKYDDAELADKTEDASKKLCKFIEHAKAKQATTDDAKLKAHLAGMVKELTADNDQVVGAVNEYMSDKKNEAKKAAVRSTCTKAIADIDKTMTAVNDSESAKAKAAEAKKKIATFEDAIDEASEDIKDAASEYAHLPKEIRDMAIQLADLIAKLAECARKGDRTGIVQTSREIAEMVKKVKAFTKPFADNCKDPVVKDKVAVASQALGNFATQLKILGSVKAAQIGDAGGDNTAEEQLVSCCEGISTSMRSALYSVETAVTGKRM